MQEYFKIGEISRLYDIGVDSLRYYERIGILHPQRSEGGYRLYSMEDIWKLNTIRDLRSLGFGMEQIRQYLEDHTVASTLRLLEQEEQTIAGKIRELQALRDNVRQRLTGIHRALERPLETFSLEQYPDRRCYYIPQGYSDEHEMDILIKKLINMDKEHLYVIGNHQIGTSISLETARKTGKVRYQSVFVVDDKGEKVLPGGTYLSVTYRGRYEQSRRWTEKTLQYAAEQGLTLCGDILEILWIDIHISADEQEHITELQVKVTP